MLNAHPNVGDFLQQPLLDADAALDSPIPREGEGSRIGRALLTASRRWSDETKLRFSRRSRSSFTSRVESLEERTVLSAMSVVNIDDSGPGSLRQAILDANETEGADVIQFAQGLEGTISLTSGQLVITDELTIDGPGADLLTVSGSGTSRVFHVGGATVAIDDLTIADGVGTDLIADNLDLGRFATGGGLLNLSGNVTVSDVHFVGNTAQGWLGSGGAIADFANDSQQRSFQTATLQRRYKDAGIRTFLVRIAVLHVP